MSRVGPPIHSLVGQQFGRLTVLSLAGRAGNRQTQWLCRCECGKEKTIVRSSLTSGHSRSCGCLHARANGDAGAGGRVAPEYSAWRGMIDRCTNPKCDSWPNYGGRGIKLWPAWRADYLAFLRDVGRRPSDLHSLDRINVNGDYEPGNVRWATAKQQVQNRRPVPRKAWREAAKHAYRVVESFEQVLSSYTGAPYVIALDSCTAALHLVCQYLQVGDVEMPRLSYVGVPASILNAGGRVTFRDEDWRGIYQLKPYPVFDAARRFTAGMYLSGTFMCLSFHWTKHLQIGRGGAILCDDPAAAAWLQRAAFDGRKRGTTPNLDKELTRGWHYYLTPNLAAQGLMLMTGMNEHNADLPRSDYPDLSTMEAFK